MMNNHVMAYNTPFGSIVGRFLSEHYGLSITDFAFDGSLVVPQRLRRELFLKRRFQFGSPAFRMKRDGYF